MNRNINIQELMSEMQNLQATQEEETGKLRRRLAGLESRRREFFDVVANNSSDFEMRHKLEEAENQLLETQQMLSRAETELKANLQDFRTRILALRNEELARLEQESKSLRQRKNEIHTELLPAAMARANVLQEEERNLTLQVEELSRRMRDLNQMELPTTQMVQ